MQILAHRGYWVKNDEKNTLPAFRRAFRHGLGIETDVRDYKEKLVVSHNVADESCILFEEVLKLYKETGSNSFLAINIKADGIQDLLMKLLTKYNIENYFVFDMSIPEQVVYRKRKFNYFTRLSEYEKEPVLAEEALGIWMDEWEESWITEQVIREYLDKGKYVSIISPEIHGRNRDRLWNIISRIEDDRLLLCTDVPGELTYKEI